MATRVRVDDAQTVLQRLEDGIVPELLAWYRQARRRLLAQLQEDGIARSRISVVASADCRYEGQGYELELPMDSISRTGVRRLAGAFMERHAAMYGHADPREPVEIVTVRVSAFGELDRHDAERVPRGTRMPSGDARVGDRRALIHGLPRAQRVPVYRRELLRARNTLEGPAIVEQMDSTVVIGRGQIARVDDEGNLWLRAGR
jgi:N-methylhydantoinase A